MTTVNVEPDTLGPWVGLVGVLVGGLLTAATTWLLDRRREKRERRTALLNACAELDAAAENTRVYSRALRGQRPEDFGNLADALSWAGAIATVMERINTLASTIAELGPEEVGSVAWRLAQAAFGVMGGDPEANETLSGTFLEFRQARNQFLSR
jgi:hypothetical protein